MTRPWHPSAWRLSSRMAALSLLLLLLVQGVSYLAIRASIEHNARDRLGQELEVGQNIWQRLVEQRAVKLNLAAGVLVRDDAFRVAVGSRETPTIVSTLQNHGARIEASVAALLDLQFAVLAVDQGPGPDLSPTLAALAPRLAERLRSAQDRDDLDAERVHLVAAVDGRPMQFVMVPMRAPLQVGWVMMGFALDQPLVTELHQLSKLHGTLVAQPAIGAPRALFTSHEASVPLDDLLQARDEVHLAGDPCLVRTVEVSAAGGDRIVLQITGSIGEAVRPYQQLQLVLAGLTVAGLLLFGVGSVWTARRVTQPLQALAEASGRLGRGDYDAPVAHTDRADEIGDLAQAFERMRVDIGAHEREIRQLAYWDKLTGLPNRVQFRDAVQAAIAGGPAAAGGHGAGLAVLMLDLDRFKHVNDVLGYASGDHLLQGVAERLRGVVRPGDTIARLGGDEFALLLAPADETQAQAMALRITQAFEQPLTLGDQTVDLSAGLGIALWPAHAREADALLSRAEVAMYAAKQRTAGAQLYDPALDSASAQTLSLLSELRHAVDADELRLYLQPKVATASGALVGAEALVRWQHPQRGLVPPMQFIPFAEQTGFIRQLTLWMFEATARLQPQLRALGVQRVSVNLSTRDLLDIELPAKLDALLARHSAAAEGFCLEITESAIMDDPQRAEATLNRLAQRGFKLSIDDFGTGYSSLAYLKRLPVDELKIDKSFVMGMERNEGDATIVRSTIDLAHNLGLSVVAEGVENAAILQRLQQLGCDEAQGYHLSKPQPVDGFVAWARQWGPPAAAEAGAAGTGAPARQPAPLH